jgi:hypothetical protein
MSRDEAERSYRLGLDLLLLDPVVADWLNPVGDVNIKILPTWVEAQPLDIDPCPEPETVLMIGTTSVPDRAWNEGIVALQRIGTNHPHLRLVACGAPASCVGEDDARIELITSMAAPSFEALLKARPLCVVLYPSGRPPWLHDLMAKGCPVIAVVASLLKPPADAEFKEGVIHVPAEGHLIAQAIESLVIDRIRLGQLLIRSAAAVRSMPGPVEAARVLLREFRAAVSQDLTLYQSRDHRSIDDFLSDVA